MKTKLNPSMATNAKTQGRKDRSSPPDTQPDFSAPWCLGVLALNFLRWVVLAVAAALLPAVAQAQGAIEAWVQSYGDEQAPNRIDDLRGLAVSVGGNVYVTGASWGGFDDPSDPRNAAECVTIAYSSAGMPLWTNRYCEPVGSDGADVAVDAGGNVIVAGTVHEASGDSRCAVVKYSSAGIALWTNRVAACIAVAMALDTNSNIFVAGSGGAGWMTVKYSSAGTLLWTKTNSSSGFTRNSLAVDPSGNVVVTGSSPGIGSNADYLTVKYSSAGVELWTRRYNGPGGWQGVGKGFDDPHALAVDGEGNVIVTGRSEGGTNVYAYATIKYSSAGIPLWTNRYNGPGNDDSATAGAVDAGGNVIVTGDSRNGANNDCTTIKYSGAGVPLWTNRYYAQGSRTAMAVDTSGNVYVTGSSGSYCATVAYSSAGLPLWTNLYNGPATPIAVALDANSSLYVVGSSVGTDINTGHTTSDYLTIKYVSPPIITRQPLSSTNAVGTTASFTVEAAGGLPLSYQWRMEGTNLVNGGNLSGVTTTNLVIANVQLADAAGYSVVITNAYGSTTSSMARLTVTIPPSPGRFTHLSYSPETGLSFIFRDATVGQPYRIQFSSSLTEGSWADWVNFSYSGPMPLTDMSAVEATNRFYRAITP